MESHLAFVSAEKIQHPACALYVIIEGPVKHSYVLDSMSTDILKSCLYLLHCLIPYWLFASADAECTGIETASGGLQLHKWLVPFEE